MGKISSHVKKAEALPSVLVFFRQIDSHRLDSGLSFSKEIGYFTRVLLKDIDDMTELNLKTFFNLYEAIEDRQRDLMTILKWNHDEALFDIIHDGT